ncbi:MAG TPA: TPM domain-containing protein [Chitinophagaceae bacterium]|nr:TPM domain-containing protein [Chitinophagaceae bacterium]MCC6635913.1 TPM domain-containing protein [Chitinophagaceae bacterium]HMZ46520.1 TPM domain-containing protein [Chitinophagaceae bacterium]HNF29818.1 TPM domain-containing protein [Chitinophagaceae bacterium]HNM34954.1 TPM domain-containing protein [Chitinophagaceae bacterium]
MLPFFKKKPTNYFSEPEKQLIVNAIKQAETNTSGEIRVFIENKCSYVDAIDRAKELFEKLKMFETEQRNGVLLYVALKDRQLAIFGDKGIYEKTGVEFWNNEVNELLLFFNKLNYAEGIANVVIQIGNALKLHFPFNKSSDVNELKDEIVFGK